MTIELLQKDILSVPCDLLVVNVFQGTVKPTGATGMVDKALDGAITKLIAQDEFEGKFGQHFIFPTLGKIKAKKVAVVGLGGKKNLDADAMLKLMGWYERLVALTLYKKGDYQEFCPLPLVLIIDNISELNFFSSRRSSIFRCIR